ncbi:glutamate ABC transporter substrate-binding protein [Demequina activiva]|uniref:Glutamate-binding protein n=1 Tax=Demequina activiva TaxID=1582364 RepID=A0A919Q249_9MICO|nr:glutamate ABC transporter substrate-binding protein [Demequina activiva]GIG54224.1 glutamate-binding protein [Demequina activiva]
MRTTSVRSVAAAAVAVLLSAVLAGCSSNEFAPDSTMARLAESGAITIGIKADQPLFGELDESGAARGFDTEIARIVADELGIAEDGIAWVEAVSGERERILADGEADLVVATYTISSERKERVGFAGPYYVAGQSLLTRMDDATIASVADLAGKDVCSVQGSTGARTIRDLAPEANVVLFEDYSACVDGLGEGQVDVVTSDDVILAGYAAQRPGEFRLVGGNVTAEPYGIGVALEDDEFRMWINDVLEEAIEDGRWKAAWDSTAGAVLPEPQRPYIDRY